MDLTSLNVQKKKMHLTLTFSLVILSLLEHKTGVFSSIQINVMLYLVSEDLTTNFDICCRANE